MPIITVQRRMTPQGNIRIGHKVTGTRKDGSTYTRPAKLEKFRFTSASQRLVEEIAAAYGGEARPWDNDGKAEYEVLTDATAIPVIVVRGGFSQWHEHFTKAGMQHRCDGEKDPAGVYCNPDDPAHIEAIQKPTTRLSVMLSEIETLGVWTLTTKGWNAAAELPSMTELAMHVGDLVPATLGLREKSSVIQTDKGPQTSRYVVPYLDLHVTKQRLVEIVGGPDGGPAAIGAGGAPTGAPALEAARPAEVPDYRAVADTLLDTDSLGDLWRQAAAAGHLDDDLKAYLTERARALQAAEQPAPAPDADGAVDAELVPDDQPPAAPSPLAGVSPDEVWAQIMQIAAAKGLATTPDLEDDCHTFLSISSAEASAEELAMYLDELRKRPEVNAA